MQPPILRGKDPAAPSQFTPENLLREARRQKGLLRAPIPEICVLDPDGDIIRHLIATGRARPHNSWACYHTELYVFDDQELPFGIIGRAVGAAFAVLVAEELFASGCHLLISVTSAGQILPLRKPPYFVVIDRALRDEGTSYHYLPPADYSDAADSMIRIAEEALASAGVVVEIGASWTTDAPFRETNEAIETAKQLGILAVEMEAAALYAFARARGREVLCFAHVTNQMGRVKEDFEKGAARGAEDSLQVITVTARHWHAKTRP